MAINYFGPYDAIRLQTTEEALELAKYNVKQLTSENAALEGQIKMLKQDVHALKRSFSILSKPEGNTDIERLANMVKQLLPQYARDLPGIDKAIMESAGIVALNKYIVDAMVKAGGH